MLFPLKCVKRSRLALFALLLCGCANNKEAVEAGKDLPRAITVYKAMGLPWEQKDLNVPTTKGKNAADLIKSSDYRFDAAKGKELMDKASIALKEGKYDEVEQTVEPLDPALALGEKAVEVGTARFEHDYDDALADEFPEYAAMKNLGKLFAWRAKDEALHGQIDLAITDLSSIKALARMAGEGQVLIAFLVNISLNVIELQAEDFCADQWANNLGGLQRLATFESTPQPEPDLQKAFRTEAFFGVAISRNLARVHGVAGVKAFEEGTLDSVYQVPIVRDGVPEDPVEQGYMDRTLHFWMENFQALKSVKDDPLKTADELRAIESRYANSHSSADVLLAMMEPYPGIRSDPILALAGQETKCQVTHALTQALLIRARTGKLPTSIDQIPGKWVNSLTFKPLKLKTTGEEIRIYGPSYTAADHGGAFSAEVSKEARGRHEYDEVAAYPWPKSEH